MFDSDGECEFVESLENIRNVKLHSKLPRGFMVETPIGDYNLDWAIVWSKQGGDFLYLVHETKFGYKDLEELSWDETQKIKSAQKYFETLGG